MQSIEIRPFRRRDRDQLTALVNLHVQAVVPAIGVSVNALMSQLEREPDEALVDPWVVERKTLVALERDAIVAGAHLLRYRDDESATSSCASRTGARASQRGCSDTRPSGCGSAR